MPSSSLARPNDGPAAESRRGNNARPIPRRHPEEKAVHQLRQDHEQEAMAEELCKRSGHLFRSLNGSVSSSDDFIEIIHDRCQVLEDDLSFLEDIFSLLGGEHSVDVDQTSLELIFEIVSIMMTGKVPKLQASFAGFWDRGFAVIIVVFVCHLRGSRHRLSVGYD